MCVRVLWLVVLMVAGAEVAGAQNLPHQDIVSDDCFADLAFGVGEAQTKLCVSSTGNVTRFETGGIEHLAVGEVLEGYQVCLGPSYGGPFDSGVQSYGFDDASIYQPNGRHTLPLRITRTATDAPIRLVQTFSVNARPYGPTELIINMKVYNTGRVTLPGVKVWRFFDADVNGDVDDDIAVRTADSATIMDLQDTPRAMVLAAGITDKRHSAGLADNLTIQYETGQAEFSRCDAHPYWRESLVMEAGDHAAGVTYDVGPILPGGVKTVEFLYRVQ